ncbi:MAG: O-antigen ligase family protein [Anaerolineae bacterium]|nr:O-antigen ligase family protein [Anaerolineae bacterium]
MRRRPTVLFVLGIVLVALATLGALQWWARYRHETRGWATAFPDPVADTPGATGSTMSRACVNAPLATYGASELTWALDTIQAGGFGWVRQQLPWSVVAPQPADQDWSSLDTLVTAVGARGLGIVAVLDEVPAWVGVPPDPDLYAAWAGAVAERYADELMYYQIWHNPNLADGWGAEANAFAYADLLARAAAAIRAADPDARIVLGSLAPTTEVGQRNFAEDLFLEMLYDAGAADDFDVVAVQPYGFQTGPDDRRVDREVLNFSRVLLVRQIMEARGDAHKAIWVSNFGWNSKPAGWPGPPSIWGEVDEATQAAYTLAALERVEREWPWMGVLCLNGLQPRPETQGLAVPDAEEHWGFALVGPEGQMRPVYEAVQAWAQRVPVAHAGVYRADTDLAEFEGPWTLGPQGADMGEHGENRVSLTFEGTDVALTVRRGPYRAFLFVTVDGRPAPALPLDRAGRAYAVLYDPLAAIATVPLAEGLPSGMHRVEVVAERGWGQWALADWRIVDAPPWAAMQPWGYVVFALLSLVGAALIALSTPKMALRNLFERCAAIWGRLADWLQIGVSFVVASIALFAAWQLLMGEALFRRLGAYGDLVALALTTGLFYLSPWLLVTLVAGLLMSLIILLRPSLGLMLTIFAAPLYAYPLSLAGKSFALAELVLLPTLVGGAARLAGTWIRERSHWRDRVLPLGRRLLVPLLVLVGVSVLSTARAAHLREALRELRLVILEPTLFFVVLVALPMTREERWRIVDALVASGVLVALVGLVMYFSGAVITAEGGARRLLSVYGSPNNVGLFLGRIIPLLVAWVLWAGPRLEAPAGASKLAAVRVWLRTLPGQRRRIAYVVALIPISLALLLSLSRGAIVLGLPVALLVMGWLAGKEWRQVAIIALVIGVVALVPLLSTPRFSGMLDLSQGTTSFRVALWHSTLQLIGEHPFLGVGPDNFLYAYRTRYVLPTAWEEFNLSHPHNVVLDYAARTGIGGVVAFLWTQVVFWRAVGPLRKRPNPATRALGIGIAGSMADFLAHGLVDASYFIIDLAFVYMFSLALAVWLTAEAGSEVASQEEVRL